VQHTPDGLEIGAAVSLNDAFAALVATRPALATFASRFAGLPVRNAGTLGGNVANGSPIGDSMPLLLALGASVRLMSWSADVQGTTSRVLPLDQFYTGYRQTAMAPAELLTHILVPAPGVAAVAGPGQADGEWLRAYKVSKRFEDDISAVCMGLWLQLDQGVVRQVRLGLGGVAATPVRAHQTEAALTGQRWNAETAATAAAVLTNEFSPISDMRASAAYRRRLLGALLHRAWVESTGVAHTNLEHTSLAQLTGVAGVIA
jgi:xanthine dehydrogenase small subunit